MHVAQTGRLGEHACGGEDSSTAGSGSSACQWRLAETSSARHWSVRRSSFALKPVALCARAALSAHIVLAECERLMQDMLAELDHGISVQLREMLHHSRAHGAGLSDAAQNNLQDAVS